MKNECSIVSDLMSLYVEKMVSSDTESFMEEHIKNCTACQKKLEAEKELIIGEKLEAEKALVFEEKLEAKKESQISQEMLKAAPLRHLRKKMLQKKTQTIIATVLFVLALLISAFAALDAPIYLPYSEDLIQVESFGDKEMLLTFDEKVTEFHCEVYKDPEGGAFSYCDISLWTTLFDQWSSDGEKRSTSSDGKRLSTKIQTKDSEPIVAVYVPNDGSENVCIGQYNPGADNKMNKNYPYGHLIVLPRLSLLYYLILAAVALVLLVLLWFLTRKKKKLHVWTERILFIPVSYILSHCFIMGFHTTSFSLLRDFFLMICLSILLYGAFLLAHNVWMLQKEKKEIERI